jgi:dephospho-CoA kinase
VDAGGAVDRARLGALVFADPEARAKLQAITHPKIVAESAARFAALDARGERVAAYEAALLVETGRWRDFAALVVVSCSPDEQRRRLAARGLSAADVEARLAAQMPSAEKEKVADAVIVNDGDLETARRRTGEAWAAVLSKIGSA